MTHHDFGKVFKANFDALKTTDEAKKLVAEALACKWPDHYCYTFPVHSRECPAYHRPAVESLVTRLQTDKERLTEAAKWAMSLIDEQDNDGFYAKCLHCQARFCTVSRKFLHTPECGYAKALVAIEKASHS